MAVIPYVVLPIMDGTVPYGGAFGIYITGKGPAIKKVTLDKGINA